MGKKKKTPRKRVKTRGKKIVRKTPPCKPRSSLLKSRILFKQREEQLAEKVALRSKVKTLFEMGLSISEIARKVGRNRVFVRTWCKAKTFLDKKRSGRPRTALTKKTMRALKQCEGKTGQSTRVLASKFNISNASVSRGFEELGLFSYRRPRQSKLKENHIKMRYECAKRYRHAPVEFWEQFFNNRRKTLGGEWVFQLAK